MPTGLQQQVHKTDISLFPTSQIFLFKYPALIHGFILAVLVLGLSACQSIPSQPPVDSSTAQPPTLDSIAVKNARHYVLIPGQSDVRVRVYRDGALASFGHNHIIATTSVSGDIYWADTFSNSRFSLSLPLSHFTVDNAAHRKMAGDAFTSAPSAEDKAGTRENMLSDDVLAAARYPTVYIQGQIQHGPQWQPLIKATITLHGVSQQTTLPVAIIKNGPSITIIGQLTLQQSDFGITPLSIFGGAVAVQDEFTVLFKLRAQKAGTH